MLLLNAVLTVREGKSNSHKRQGWEAFTSAVLRVLNDCGRPLVFVLWGKPAQVCGTCSSCFPASV